MYDAVVIGLGGVGSFALRALSKTGGTFLGLERFHRLHNKGSSHGKSRIYRRAYFENPNYVPWIEHSIAVFRELERTWNVSLLNECGTLLVAPSTEGNTQTLPPLLNASQRSAYEHGVPVEFISSSELKQRYPQLNVTGKHNATMVGLLEPQAGLVRPECAMDCAIRDAKTSGCINIMENTHVTAMKQLASNDISGAPILVLQVQRDIHDNGIVKVEEEEVVTKCVLISMGAWTSQIVPSWSSCLTVTRQLQAWIDVEASSDDPGLYRSDCFPAWYMESPDWPLPLYGLPCDPNNTASANWIKVSAHCRNDLVSDIMGNSSRVSSQEYAELQQIAMHGLVSTAWSRQSPASQPNFVDTIPCLYTMSPDGHFMIGTPKNFPKNVFAIAGLSGHGFKMTPALGQMMADFATGKDLEAWKLNFCSPSRYGL